MKLLLAAAFLTLATVVTAEAAYLRKGVSRRLTEPIHVVPKMVTNVDGYTDSDPFAELLDKIDKQVDEEVAELVEGGDPGSHLTVEIDPPAKMVDGGFVMTEVEHEIDELEEEIDLEMEELDSSDTEDTTSDETEDESDSSSSELELELEDIEEVIDGSDTSTEDTTSDETEDESDSSSSELELELEDTEEVIDGSDTSTKDTTSDETEESGTEENDLLWTMSEEKLEEELEEEELDSSNDEEKEIKELTARISSYESGVMGKLSKKIQADDEEIESKADLWRVEKSLKKSEATEHGREDGDSSETSEETEGESTEDEETYLEEEDTILKSIEDILKRVQGEDSGPERKRQQGANRGDRYR